MKNFLFISSIIGVIPVRSFGPRTIYTCVLLLAICILSIPAVADQFNNIINLNQGVKRENSALNFVLFIIEITIFLVQFPLVYFLIFQGHIYYEIFQSFDLESYVSQCEENFISWLRKKSLQYSLLYLILIPLMVLKVCIWITSLTSLSYVSHLCVFVFFFVVEIQMMLIILSAKCLLKCVNTKIEVSPMLYKIVILFF
jgi:hypothetical protein